LCDASTFQNACEGPQVDPCTWGYSTTVACDHAFNSTAYENLCHGAESMEDDVITCADGSSSCSAVTGSTAFAQCFANWTGGPISDLSGNIQEWTNTIRTNLGETCTTYAATGLPIVGPDSGTPSVTSTITVPAGGAGTVTNVRVLNLQGTSTEVGELEFQLRSPANTTNLLINNRCGGDDNWAFDLDDAAASAVTAGSFCTGGGPIGGNVNTAWRPETAFSGFDGQQAQGAWSLLINDTDSGGNDFPTLTGWSLEVCIEAQIDTGYRDIRGGAYNDVEAGRSCSFDFEIGSTGFRFPTTGFRCCRY